MVIIRRHSPDRIPELDYDDIWNISCGHRPTGYKLTNIETQGDAFREITKGTRKIVLSCVSKVTYVCAKCYHTACVGNVRHIMGFPSENDGNL